MGAAPTDAELHARIKAADREEDELTRKQAVELTEGPCPVCAAYPPQERASAKARALGLLERLAVSQSYLAARSRSMEETADELDAYTPNARTASARSRSMEETADELGAYTPNARTASARSRSMEETTDELDAHAGAASARSRSMEETADELDAYAPNAVSVRSRSMEETADELDAYVPSAGDSRPELPASGLWRTTPVIFVPFLSRPALKCEACDVEIPPQLNFVAWTLATLSVFVLALGAVFLIFQAQRLDEATPRALAFGGGALLLAVALSTGYMLHSSGSVTLVARELLRARRRARGDRTLRTPSDWAGETLEAIVISIILELLIRHVAIEAFVIPTGSMAPTLLGDHYEVECGNCLTPFAIGRDNKGYAANTTASAYCPQCELLQTYTMGPRDVTGGDKILVNKLCYALRDPERYDVAVFVYPEQPWEHYIKRVIGLPGETLEIENGDVFVDGKRARKPDAIQDALWIPVWSSNYARRSRSTGKLWVPWNEVGRDPKAWDITDENHPTAIVRGGDPPAWLKFVRENERLSDRGIRDHYPYSAVALGTEAVADLRVAATVRTGATVRLGINENDRVVAARFPVGPGEQTFAIEVDGSPVAEAAYAGLSPGASHELVLAYADDRARLIVDGVLVLSWIDAFAPDRTQKAGVQLQADGACSFDALEIGRDIHYTLLHSRGATDPSVGEVEVPPDCFFMLGDNSPNSEDSRAWGFVRREHLVGRAFGVFWPVLPSRLKAIR